MQLMRPRRPWLVKYGILALLAMALITLVACVSSDVGTVENRDSRGAKILATAQATVTGTPLAPTITGNISLEETTAGLAMRGTFDNVPAGMHGFHIHEGDSCAEDGKAAGGHFNPRDVQHGHLPSTGVENAHAGDLGNLQGSDHHKGATVLRTLSGHQGAVEAVAFHPAGTHLASAGSDNQVILWRAADGTRLASATDHGDRVTSVAFSPDGQRLATGSADKTIRLWSTADDRLTLIATLTGHTDEVTSVNFHPRQPLLLSGSYDKTVRLWQIPAGTRLAGNPSSTKATLVQTLSEPNEAVSGVQFSPKGDRIAAASWDSQLYVWQLQGQSPQLLTTLGGHDGGVSALAFSAEGQTLVSGSASGTVQLWNSHSGQRLKRLFGDAGTVNALALSQDTQLLVSGAKQGGLGLWEMQLPGLMTQGCDRLGSYLRTNATLTPEARSLCKRSTRESANP